LESTGIVEDKNPEVEVKTEQRNGRGGAEDMRRLWRFSAVVGLTVILLVTLFAGVAPARGFSDVGTSDWFSLAVDELSNAGVVAGYPDGSFHPGEMTTRGQFAAMLARIINPPPATTTPFVDIGPGDANYAAIAALYNAGLLAGSTSTTFQPDAPVDRAQTASLIIRALTYRLAQQPQPGISMEMAQADVNQWLSGFRDRTFIGSPHDLSVALAVRTSLLTGQQDGRFYPFFSLSRAQAAGVLYRAFYLPLSMRTFPPPAVPVEEGYDTLTLGAEGPLVLWLEQRLAAMMHQVGAVDGVFDEATQAAVTSFQKAEGLERTRICDTAVWQSLGSAHVVTARYQETGMRWEVDLTRQLLILFDGDTVLKVLDCSTGMPGLETPTGHFQITWKVPGWRNGMYLPSYFVGGCAIHGGYTVNVYPSSHGCVRIHNWDADVIYDLLPVGRTVDVYY
jgi:peptidoglycan hydrolase-like protein with peptidoglycan-binding domain